MSVRLYSNVEVAETGDAPAAHNVLGANHSITGGAALDLVGQSGANTIARVTPSASPGAAARILASAADGLLTLAKIIVTNHIRAGGGLYLGKTTTDPARGEIRTSDATITGGVLVARPTGWGFDPPTYRVIQLGPADSAIKETVAIGYDPSVNSWSALGGDGREVIFRRGIIFVTPDAANTLFYKNIYLLDGMVAFGSSIAPSTVGRSQVRSFGLVGGSLIWDYNGLDGTNRTVKPHDVEDVVSLVLFHYIIQPSAGAAVSATTTLTPNTNTTLYNVGADVVTIYCNTNGSVTVQRTGGTLTYKVILQLLWL
jgi:hypothetical protein